MIRQKERGFTLVELLVVMAVIGLLMALLLPAVQAARERARTANCASNMRQVGFAIMRYADMHHEHWPETTHSTEADPVTGKYEKAWVYSLAKYLEDVEAIRICPSDLAGDLRVRGKGTSYALNGWLSSEARPPFDSRRKIAATSKTVVAFELSEERDIGAMRSGDPADIDIFYDHVHSFNWFRASHIAAGTVLAAIRSDVPIERHQGASHFLYADGHVDLVSGEQVAQWAVLPLDFSKPLAR